ncbi:MAG: hypothetical protein OEY56_10660, partial [Cyclobacteriaceae bacterium]|nr:hypothetical protein [Cyclobacteriaceae bacterium]
MKHNLHGELDIRDLELNALLEITQAINNNLSEGDLYRIYRFTLLGDLKVKRMAMFVQANGWECKVHFGTAGDIQNHPLPSDYESMEASEIVGHPHPFDQFDFVFPVRHKEKLLAVVFVGGMPETE